MQLLRSKAGAKTDAASSGAASARLDSPPYFLCSSPEPNLSKSRIPQGELHVVFDPLVVCLTVCLSDWCRWTLLAHVDREAGLYVVFHQLVVCLTICLSDWCRWTLLAHVDREAELYVVFDPLVDKEQAARICDQLRRHMLDKARLGELVLSL